MKAFRRTAYTSRSIEKMSCPYLDSSSPKLSTRENKASACPFGGTRIGGVQGTGPAVEAWYPRDVHVEILSRPSPKSNPYGPDFNYAEAFSKIDFAQLKKDLHEWMHTSQSWWPADYGHYGPQMIRTSWHSAGTYRVADGRGGAGNALQRFLPINSWIDNGNTDKTRRLLWPIKQKYGDSLSWADLLVLAGNVAFESMGAKTIGFGGGRVDAWEPDLDTYWGPEVAEDFGRGRWHGTPKDKYYDLEDPLSNSEAALIYVNPEGPAANPDPIGSARDIRNTFRRMAMNDEETVALIAGGHTFGKSHGAVSKDNVGPPPTNASIEHQGLGWINKAGTGNAQYTMTNGIEGSWVQHPTRWDSEYLDNLLDLEWEVTKSPAGANQWKPKVIKKEELTPDAHIAGKENPLMMMTSDIALKDDPEFNKIIRRYRDEPEVFLEAFAQAWFKLTHRDMGPKIRYLGPEVPKRDFIWQDPIPPVTHTLIDDSDIASLKHAILETGVEPIKFAKVAWASASTHRVTDYRGGANGARIRLSPQKDWEVNNPAELEEVLSALEGVQKSFNGKQSGDKQVSLADLIILGGAAAIEGAIKKGGLDLKVPFVPGRADTTQEDTDIESFEWLRPIIDGFRNYEKLDNVATKVTPEAFLVDRAQLLGLTPPQLVALVGGLRVLGMNWDNSKLGVFTDKPGALTNDFFVNLLTPFTSWKPVDEKKTRFQGIDSESGKHLWDATRVDLIFGHDAQLRAVCEVYGSANGQERFVKDFISAWNHVMNLDRFDLHN